MTNDNWRNLANRIMMANPVALMGATAAALALGLIIGLAAF